jgi:oxygen-dependent protoporphyrinogen oxidase
LLSIRAAFPRVAHLEAEYGSVLKGMIRSARQRRQEAAARGEPYRRSGKMWSFRPGLRLLVETLAERLRRPPLYGISVRKIMSTEGRWSVHGPGAEQWPADAVVLTCPAYQQAAILADLDAKLAEAIAAIPYNRIAVVALGYRAADVPNKLDGFGYIAPQRLRRDVLGVQWCSSIYPDRAPSGLILLRALCGGWHRPEVPGWDDDRLLEAVRAELRITMNIQAAPLFHYLVRWDRAIPQYQLGHLERVATIETQAGRYPGLYLGGNAYRGVALNDCTEQAELVAESVRRFLDTARPAHTSTP